MEKEKAVDRAKRLGFAVVPAGARVKVNSDKHTLFGVVDDETWLSKNKKALRSVKKGIKEAEDGKISKVDMSDERIKEDEHGKDNT
jgi:hypothetical protein